MTLIFVSQKCQGKFFPRNCLICKILEKQINTFFFIIISYYDRYSKLKIFICQYEIAMENTQMIVSDMYTWKNIKSIKDFNFIYLLQKCGQDGRGRRLLAYLLHRHTKIIMINKDATYKNWGRKWQPTPVFLPGKSNG